ncbi:MAG TPA: glucose 1-dehydrogenase [Bryobacteraceae bacterium]|nr:glucose 1-dehydrogenase [Bryobacteraceae bacterium]
MSRLKGKVAVVTGASKGIGAGIAKALAAEGASVVVNYASSKEGADKVVADITGAGGKAISAHGDVGNSAGVEKLFADTKKTFGKLDILVNNAGVFHFEPLEAVTEKEFHRQFNINVLGTVLATQQALKLFGPDGGSVVNVSSVVSTGPPPMSSVYSATKGAIDTLTVALSRELAPKKIRVNSVNPGLTETEGLHTAGFLGGDQEKQVLASTPLGRVGQPDDIAKAVVFLASDDSRWITGETVRVSGGLR